jgi:hypothetical protein
MAGRRFCKAVRPHQVSRLIRCLSLTPRTVSGTAKKGPIPCWKTDLVLDLPSQLSFIPQPQFDLCEVEWEEWGQYSLWMVCIDSEFISRGNACKNFFKYFPFFLKFPFWPERPVYASYPTADFGKEGRRGIPTARKITEAGVGQLEPTSPKKAPYWLGPRMEPTPKATEVVGSV